MLENSACSRAHKWIRISATAKEPTSGFDSQTVVSTHNQNISENSGFNRTHKCIRISDNKCKVHNAIFLKTASGIEPTSGFESRTMVHNRVVLRKTAAAIGPQSG
ncbi:hypothetical protein CEXT_247361 [Caerostris extrusa]|uniref:Uncharacterized protein n=1 Tax=Caerostris extrusa TaxID=172846 RepID=A0AAV4NQ79_CAEEX|nr:hypothetical protein CEXT_247361 [Caerostris extrusa]